MTGNNADDGSAAPQLLSMVSPDEFPRLQAIFGDDKYRNKKLNMWLKKERPGWSVEIKMRPKDAPRFEPVRKPWVVERSNAWHSRCRRNSKSTNADPILARR